MGLPFGLDKKVAKLVLKIIDDTIGKKFKIVDKITDQFQDGLEKVDNVVKEANALKKQAIDFKKRIEILEEALKK
jgi:hypothetical protein